MEADLFGVVSLREWEGQFRSLASDNKDNMNTEPAEVTTQSIHFLDSLASISICRLFCYASLYAGAK
jgi:hypothetical protein